jgi:hypothetical protein
VVDVEFTLTRRDQMGFRMLLGRQALRGRFLVDTGRSYLLGQPPRTERQANRSPDSVAGSGTGSETGSKAREHPEAVPDPEPGQTPTNG